jgi:hypothetical protein
MRDAKYLRDQAELCLEIARQLSDPAAAQRVRLDAAAFLTQAENIERASECGVEQARSEDGPEE